MNCWLVIKIYSKRDARCGQFQTSPISNFIPNGQPTHSQHDMNHSYYKPRDFTLEIPLLSSTKKILSTDKNNRSTHGIEREHRNPCLARMSNVTLPTEDWTDCGWLIVLNEWRNLQWIQRKRRFYTPWRRATNVIYGGWVVRRGDRPNDSLKSDPCQIDAQFNVIVKNAKNAIKYLPNISLADKMKTTDPTFMISYTLISPTIL